LLNFLLEINNSLVLVGGQLVDGVNHFVSEILEHIHDFLDEALVGEVLGAGKGEQGSEHGAGLDSVPHLLLLHLLHVGGELLKLDQRRVGKRVQEVEGLVNGVSSIVVLTKLALEGLVVLLSEEGLLGKSLPVVGDVVLEVVDLGLDLVSPGNEQAVDQIFGSGNVSLGALDVELERNEEGVVLIGSLVKVKF
jgi:hypothetical protein